MARITLQLPGFNGVASGANNAQASLGVGNLIYDSIAISITKAGTLVALSALDTDVSEVRVLADSRVIRRFTPAMLLAFLQSKGRDVALTDGTNAVCSMYVPFMDPTRPTVQGQEATALGTMDVGQLLLQIDFKATGAVYTAFASARARIGAKSVKFIETWQIETLPLINGVASLNTLPTVDDYLGLIIMSGTASRVSVDVDANRVYDAFKTDAIGALRSHAVGATAANAFPVAWDTNGQVTDALPMATRDNTGKVTARVSTMNWQITDSAGANVKALRRNLWLGN
jgi:hypothetical protein